MSAEPELWTSNTLRRATSQAYRTLQKARERHIEYPQSTKTKTPPYGLEPLGGHSTLEESYSSVMQSLSSASRQVLRYYRSSTASEQNKFDRRFCARYLKPKVPEKKRINPLQSKEDLHITVAPGTYSITAGGWHKEEQQQQTHVINVRHGETAAIDFTI